MKTELGINAMEASRKSPDQRSAPQQDGSTRECLECGYASPRMYFCEICKVHYCITCLRLHHERTHDLETDSD